jgi:hypothetical protein
MVSGPVVRETQMARGASPSFQGAAEATMCDRPAPVIRIARARPHGNAFTVPAAPLATYLRVCRCADPQSHPPG